MPLTPESRKSVDLQFAKAAEEIGNSHRKEIERIQQTHQRGGGMRAAIDRQVADTVKETTEALVMITADAFEREGAIPSDADIDGIVRKVEQMVRGATSNPMSPMLISSREMFETIPHAARRDLLIIKSRLEIEARRRVQTRATERVEAEPVRAALPERLHIDDIESFERVRGVSPQSVADLLKDGFLDVSEDLVQTALESILDVPQHKKDWGGETNDLYTANVSFGGRRRASAFLLKGNGLTKKMMEIRDCGKNGDQLLRLASSAASLLFVQYVGNISEAVVGDIAGKVALLRARGDDASYCIIDGQDTARLLRAYGRI